MNNNEVRAKVKQATTLERGSQAQNAICDHFKKSVSVEAFERFELYAFKATTDETMDYILSRLPDNG